MSHPNKLLVVDGTNVVMRYVSVAVPDHVFPSQTDKDRALNYVESSVERVASTFGAGKVVVALDSPQSWRRDEFAGYKRGRALSTKLWSDILVARLPYLTLRVEGFEADDIVATCVRQATAAGMQVALLSSDSDLLMLAEACHVYQFGKPNENAFVRRDPEYVKKKYGVSVSQLLAYKALVGESGESVPGVFRVGPKKAAKLLGENLDEKTVVNSLSASQQEEFKLALRLVTLREDSPIPSTWLSDPKLTVKDDDLLAGLGI